MNNCTTDRWTRRRLLRGFGAMGAVGLFDALAAPASAEPPPETTTIRLFHQPLACLAPMIVAESLLLAEGFRQVEYVPLQVGLRSMDTHHSNLSVALNTGQIDLGALDPPAHLLSLDAGGSAILLAGLHAGCYKLLAAEQIRAVRDLKGKTVAVPSPGRHAFVASIVSYIGLDPHKDIVWANATVGDAMRRFAEGELDAFLGFAPEPEELLARGVGHVLVDTLTDKPWS
jgi:NitT/TauT family transport system substrate-binding protein